MFKPEEVILIIFVHGEIEQKSIENNSKMFEDANFDVLETYVKY